MFHHYLRVSQPPCTKRRMERQKDGKDGKDKKTKSNNRPDSLGGWEDKQTERQRDNWKKETWQSFPQSSQATLQLLCTRAVPRILEMPPRMKFILKKKKHVNIEHYLWKQAVFITPISSINLIILITTTISTSLISVSILLSRRWRSFNIFSLSLWFLDG